MALSVSDTQNYIYVYCTVSASLQNCIFIYRILCRLGYKTAFIFTVYCLNAIFNLRLLLGFIAELYLNLLYTVSASLQNYNYISSILCLGHLQIQAQADSRLYYKATRWSKRFLNLLLFDHSSLVRTHYLVIKSFVQVTRVFIMSSSYSFGETFTLWII